jgi:hypothetical protein
MEIKVAKKFAQDSTKLFAKRPLEIEPNMSMYVV